tara:strand:+ start:3635 stop:5638 length:2004 start_codon:yes stop_codon:yes gene_type:complete
MMNVKKINLSQLYSLIYYSYLILISSSLIFPLITNLYFDQDLLNYFTYKQSSFLVLLILFLAVISDGLFGTSQIALKNWRTFHIFLTLSIGLILFCFNYEANHDYEMRLKLYIIFAASCITFIKSLLWGQIFAVIFFFSTIFGLYFFDSFSELTVELIEDYSENHFTVIPQYGYFFHLIHLGLEPFFISMSSNFFLGKIIDIYQKNIQIYQRLNKKLNNLVYKDKLTQLATRDLIKPKFQKYLPELDRNALAISLTLLDIDKFKVINTTFGHPAGDKVLIHVSKTLLEISEDIFRLGGDEFCIIKCHYSDESIDEYSLEIDRICKKFQKINYMNMEVKYRFSAGTFLSTDKISIDEVMREADICLRMSKTKAHNKHKISQSPSNKLNILENGMKSDFMTLFYEKNIHLNSMNAELEAGIINKEICYYLQPIINISSKKVIAVEALLRWEKEGEIFHTLSSFISHYKLMETTDPFFDIINKNRIELIKAINAEVELEIHFNFNSDFFNSQGVPKGIISLPKKLFGSAKNIVIEITEEYLSENEEDALSEFLAKARENGNKIALDDFPSKQSNLNRLMDYNVDIIKIDKKLISKIDVDNKSKVMLKHLKNMCDNLNIEIIVEGVYSEKIMNTLINMGIFNHQGFYYHKPMKVSDFLEKMQTQNIRMPSL